MPKLTKLPLIVCALAVLASCDEAAMQQMSTDTVVMRGNKSCLAAVDAETGTTGATLSNAAVILEVNQILVDAGNGSRWSCFTDENGQATSLIKRG